MKKEENTWKNYFADKKKLSQRKKIEKENVKKKQQPTKLKQKKNWK